MSFSPEWLALREPLDHASRARDLAMQVATHFAGRDEVSVVDLGCGTGSNLRATSLLLPARQAWLLVDYDPALLAAARTRLAGWAEASAQEGETLVLTKAGRRIDIRFRQADLSNGAAPVLGGRCDLVTASALFDLISAGWISGFARDVAASGAAFYTVLTYDGIDKFGPKHPLDAAVIAAFASHQGSDKGFGPAAGPHAPQALRDAFKAVGYGVDEASSPWRIGIQDKALGKALLSGMAAAVAETGRIPQADLEAWRAFRLAAVETTGGRIITGHTDTFAVPG